MQDLSTASFSSSRAPLHPLEFPSRPWVRVHIDHLGPFLGKLYLLLIDAHSKWIEVHVVPSTSTKATIEKLRIIFATHGIPEQLVSDNGSGFTSQEFSLFMERNGIKHILTSPYHTSSYGLAECAVQTFKNGIRQLECDVQERISMFLFRYRVTPHSTTGLSPAELLMGQRFRTHLDLLYPDASRKVI